jgi:hydrogenase nickel incorporation protein HypB
VCGQCGCDEPSTAPYAAPKRQRLELHQRLLSRNDSQAAHNRTHFQAHGLNAVNLLSAPGSGKTALLERASGTDPHR